MKQSELDKFRLYYEYDKSYPEIRKLIAKAKNKLKKGV